MGCLPYQQSDSGITIRLGDLQIAQSRDIWLIVELPVDASDLAVAETSYVTASLTYRKTGDVELYHQSTRAPLLIPGEDEGPSLDSERACELAEVACQRWRAIVVEVLIEACRRAGLRRDDPANSLMGARDEISVCSEAIRSWLEVDGERLKQYWDGDGDSAVPSPWARVEALLQDVDGQGVEVYCT